MDEDDSGYESGSSGNYDDSGNEGSPTASEDNSGNESESSGNYDDSDDKGSKPSQKKTKWLEFQEWQEIQQEEVSHNYAIYYRETSIHWASHEHVANYKWKATTS